MIGIRPATNASDSVINFNTLLPEVIAFINRVNADDGTIEAINCLNNSIKHLKDLGLYDDISLLVTPNAYKASKIYSIIPTSGAGDLSFTRASAGMRRNAISTWVNETNNIPRLNYPIGGGCPSWLFEPQSTNIVLRSTDFSLDWIAVSATIAPTAIASPIDSVNWSRFTINNATGQDRISQNLTIAAGLTYTLSVYLKSDTFSGDVILRGDVSGNTANATINLSTGVITNSGANVISSRTYLEGNGRRLELTFTTVLNPSIDITTFNTGVSGVSFLFTQFQLETGSVATSPIITAGSTVTRVGDYVPFTPISSSLLPQAQGTIFWDIIPQLDTAFGDQGFSVAYNGTWENSIAIYFIPNARRLAAEYYISATPYSIATSANFITSGNRYKIALSITPYKMVLFINGVKIREDNIIRPTQAFAHNGVGIGYPAGITCGKHNQIGLFSQSLTDAECIALTTL